MLRRLALLVSGALVASALMILPASPASAQQECTGIGTAVTGAGLVYVGLGPAVSTSFNFAFNVGACVELNPPSVKANITASGSVNGNCGLSSGAGVDSKGRVFAFVGIGSMLVITGGINGGVNATPDAINGESCVSGADRFIITGGVVG